MDIIGYFTNDGIPVDSIDLCNYAQLKLHGNHALEKEAITLISKSSIKEVTKYKWYLGKDGYPVTYGDKNRRFGRGRKLHQYVYAMKYPRGYVIDHINRNRLDNRLGNLRLCTIQQNNYNRTKSKNSKYKFKGVRKERNGTWTAYLNKDGQEHKMDNLPDERTAAQMYDIIAEQAYGKYAAKNFG